jgi:hypothetical protein
MLPQHAVTEELNFNSNAPKSALKVLGLIPNFSKIAGIITRL